MHKTVHQAVNSAISRAKAATSILDAKFLTVGTPPVTSKSASPGDILALIAQTGGRDITARDTLKQIGAIKKELYAQHAKAQADIEGARKRCGEFLDAAEFIKDGTPMPAVDPLIRMMAESARKGVLAGAVPSTYADQLKTIAMQGLTQLFDAENKRLESIKSAGRCAYASQFAKALAVLADHPGYSQNERRVLKQLRHRAAVSAEQRFAAHRNNLKKKGTAK